MEESSNDHKSGGIRVLYALACIVIIIGGLKAAAPLLVPVVLAFFLSVLSLPILRVLRAWGFPRFIAVLLTIVVDLGIISPIALVSFNLVNEFQGKVDDYQRKITKKAGEWRTHFEAEHDMKFELEQEKINQYIEDGVKQLLGFLGKTIAVAKDFVFIVIVMIFFLTEAGGFRRKLKAIHLARGPDLERFQNTAKDLQKYLGIKTAISSITGVLAGLLTWSLDVNFPVLWALVAFIFNYIPAIGSIIASFPPAILALVDHSSSTALFVLLGYLAINMVLGNFIEPMLMGQRFGVSTSVVILSVLFWGWVWGLIGMFLAVPLTMVVKVILDNSEDLQWLSIAMGKRDEATAIEEGAAEQLASES
jgi:predicted PurR-regulated permease PerM